MKIAFIGLGIMGGPMAGHLLAAGYPLRAYDLNHASLERVAAQGATACGSAAEAAQGAGAVISMVPDSPDVRAVYLGEAGVLAGVAAGTLLIDMSTISPVTAQEVAVKAQEAGCAMLDAPVSGGEVGAREARLSIMVGGEMSAYERAVPLLSHLGKTTYCGASGSGQVVKACNQIQVALNLIGMAEALVLGAKAGVDPAIVVQVLSGGYAQTRVMDVRGSKVLQGDYTPGFRSRFHYKDLNIIREAARAYGASLPASALAHELYSAMQSNGWDELDHSAVVKVIELLSNAQLPTADETTP